MSDERSVRSGQPGMPRWNGITQDGVAFRNVFLDVTQANGLSLRGAR